MIAHSNIPNSRRLVMCCADCPYHNRPQEHYRTVCAHRNSPSCGDIIHGIDTKREFPGACPLPGDLEEAG